MTLYELLEVSPNATVEEIHSSYKKLVRKYHPDLFQGDKAVAEAKMKELNEAKRILTDDNLREIYNFEMGVKPKPDKEKAAATAKGASSKGASSKGKAAYRGKPQAKKSNVGLIVAITFAAIFLLAGTFITLEALHITNFTNLFNDTSDQDLILAKARATLRLDDEKAKYNETNYRPYDSTTNPTNHYGIITAAYENAKTQITGYTDAQSIENNIDSIINAFVTAASGVLTDAQLTDIENQQQQNQLEQLRQQAQQQLDDALALFEESKYSPTNYARIVDYYNIAVQAIEAGTTKQVFDDAIETFKQYAELIYDLEKEESEKQEQIKRELRAEQEKAAEAFAAEWAELYKEADYSSTNYQHIVSIYNEAYYEINADIYQDKDDFLGKLTAIITKAKNDANAVAKLG